MALFSSHPVDGWSLTGFYLYYGRVRKKSSSFKSLYRECKPNAAEMRPQLIDNELQYMLRKPFSSTTYESSWTQTANNAKLHGPRVSTVRRFSSTKSGAYGIYT